MCLSAFPIACAGGSPPAIDAEMRVPVAETQDSAGIELRTIRGDTANLPRWHAEPSGVRLGATDCGCPQDFGSVVGALLLSDGSTVVADNIAKQLHFFSRDGSYLRSVGRTGSGPGEFRQIHSITRVQGDEVAVWDTWLRRSTIFRADGSVRTVQLQTPPPRPEARSIRTPVNLYTVFALPGGRWVSVAEHVVLPPQMFINKATIRAVPGALIMHDSTGAVDATLLEISTPELLYPERSPSPAQFGNVNHGTPHGGVRWHVSAAEDAIAVARSDDFVIRLYNSRGELQQVLGYPDLNTLYSDEEFADRRARALAPPDGKEVSEYFRHVYAREFKPKSRPVLSDLRLDPAGRIWAREWGQNREDPQRWLVLDRRAAAVAVAELPSDVQIADVHGEFVLILYRDEWGVQYVERLRWVPA
jgi:hypothetical protein